MVRFRCIIAMITLVLLTASTSRGAVYMIDPDHSDILLSATHLGIGTVQGRFERFSGTFAYDPMDVGASRVSVRIDAASIDTRQELRDQHLRSADFLDVGKYPEINFVSTEVTAIDRSRFKILGNLSMHGTVRPTVLLATVGGSALDMNGKNRIALSISGDINRRDFNILWNRMVGSSPLVGQFIRFSLVVEGVEQAPEGQ